MVASLQRVGQRRAHIEHLASINIAARDLNTADRRPHALRDSHQHAGAAMAPGPGTGAILAKSGTLAAPAGGRHLQRHLVAGSRPVVRCAGALALMAILQRAGQRRARIEHLARVNVTAHGHNIDLVDVRTLSRIYVAVPAPRRP